jgi:hypothetical protein
VGARFFAYVQTGLEAHSAPCTICTGSFTGVKRPGRGVYHTHPPNAEVKERVELYLYSPSGSSWPVLGRTLPKEICWVGVDWMDLAQVRDKWWAVVNTVMDIRVV